MLDRTRVRRIAAVVLGSLLTVTRPVSAQEGANVREPVRIMLLGSYHMANPGLDQVNPEADDPRSPRRQREIIALVGALAEFQPTKIALEHPFSQQEALDEVYRGYLAGELELSRSESQQIGFRLARDLGHERVHALDYRMAMPMDSAFEFAQRHGQSAVLGELGRRGQAVERYLNELILDLTVPEILIKHNESEADTLWSVYMTIAMIGDGDDYPGAHAVAQYYERNLKIFSNVTRIAQPGDRILLIIGSGHLVPLRHYLQHAAGFELVSPVEYLEEAAEALEAGG